MSAELNPEESILSGPEINKEVARMFALVAPSIGPSTEAIVTAAALMVLGIKFARRIGMPLSEIEDLFRSMAKEMVRTDKAEGMDS
jgi:hypothetical protein